MAENTNPLIPQQQALVKALQEKGGKISLMVAGKTGTGKSSLINSLLGLDHDIGAREGDDGKIVTESVSSYKAEKNGIVIECWDTPGFQDTESTEKIIAQMSVKTEEKLDLLLYCIMYGIGGRVDDGQTRMIREMTQAFKSDIWQRAVFVMTMVNTMHPSVTKDKHISKLKNIGTQLRETLRENGVPDDIALNVPLVTAGYEEGILPHETIEWTAKLFGHCLDRLNSEGPIKLTRKRNFFFCIII